MINITEYTKQQLLHFIFEVQGGRVPNKLLLEYAADALCRSLKKNKPDVLPPVPRGRTKGEQRDLDREICIVWLRKIRKLTQDEVCERLCVGDTTTIRRAEDYFRNSTLDDVRNYNQILGDYRFGRKTGVIPAGEYYKVLGVFGERHIVDEDGEKEAQKFIFEELIRSHEDAIASMTKGGSK